MRKVREILRLSAAGLSARQISRSCGVARSTVAGCLQRVSAAGLGWPLPEGLDDEELERKVFPGQPALRERDVQRPLPEWAMVREELTRDGVTLRLVWEEYRQGQSNGYGYSQFCEHYRRWLGRVECCLRQSYAPGERMFVDFAGMTMPWTDRQSGQVHQAQVFVAALGASHYLYAQATGSQQLQEWIEAHVHAFEHLRAVPRLVVPDNLKSAVTRACWYDPDVNPAYQDMAQHYGVGIVPARPAKPRDKAKVETGVQIVEREVIAPLRHCTFFSLGELNEAIRQRLVTVNTRPFQKLKVSRRDLLEELDRPAMKPLPERPYEYADFKKVRVSIDYHVEVHGHYYSVPYGLKGAQLDARVTARLVELLHKGRRVASHVRDDHAGRHTTEPAHMPKAHREHVEWTPTRIIAWAGKIGPDCARVVENIIASRPHPEQGYRPALGIIRLARGYGDARVNAACRRALSFNVCRYRSIQSILKTGMDRDERRSEPLATSAQRHDNVRGATYYTAEGTVNHAQ